MSTCLGTLRTIREIVTALWHAKATGGGVRKKFMTFAKKARSRVCLGCVSVSGVFSGYARLNFRFFLYALDGYAFLDFVETPLHLRFLGEEVGGPVEGASRGGGALRGFLQGAGGKLCIFLGGRHSHQARFFWIADGLRMRHPKSFELTFANEVPKMETPTPGSLRRKCSKIKNCLHREQACYVEDI